MDRCSPQVRSPASSVPVPRRASIKVDLPAPLGPSKPMREPGNKVTLILFRIAVWPWPATPLRMDNNGLDTLSAIGNSKLKGESTWAGAIRSIRSNAFTRLWAWRALVALALKRSRSEEHTSELQSRPHLVCRLLLEKK